MKNRTATVFLSVLAGLLVVVSCKKEPTNIVVMPETCRGSYEIVTQGYNDDSVYIYFPTVFTPNGDGLNDIFGAIGVNMTQTDLSIHKNNEPVFQSSPGGQPWDGMHNGQPGDGVYSFSAKVETIHKEIITIVGSVEVYGSNTVRTFQNCSNCVFPDQFEGDKGAIRPTQEPKNLCN